MHKNRFLKARPESLSALTDAYFTPSCRLLFLRLVYGGHFPLMSRSGRQAQMIVLSRMHVGIQTNSYHFTAFKEKLGYISRI